MAEPVWSRPPAVVPPPEKKSGARRTTRKALLTATGPASMKADAKAARGTTAAGADNREDEPHAKSRGEKREERKARFGVDCLDKVTWKNWAPGGEYVASIDLTNCRPKLQVLQYKLPQQKAVFFLEFPEPITLSSGMRCSIRVSFRPTRLAPFTDSVEIVTDKGSFFVDLEALIPYTAMSVPEKHDFGMSPVQLNTDKTIRVSNTGTLPVNFAWDVPSGAAEGQLPFSVAPAAGSLQAGESTLATVSFRPLAASVFVAAAVLRFGDKTRVLKLSGVGKYPFVRASAGVFDFGEVYLGVTAEKKLILKNPSQVRANWVIEKPDRTPGDPFSFSPLSGVIQPDGSACVKVTYAPLSCGLYTLNDYTVRTVGGADVKLNCCGTGVGPDLSISTRSIHFGDQDIASTSAPRQKVVMIANSSPHPATFQVVNNGPGIVFRCAPHQGVIPAATTVNLTIEFVPSEACNYYKRIYVLAVGAAQPLWIDCMGTCVSAKSRPPPIQLRHVHQMRARERVGLAKLTPEEAVGMLSKLGLLPEQGVAPGDGSERGAASPAAPAEKDAAFDLAEAPGSDADAADAFSQVGSGGSRGGEDADEIGHAAMLAVEIESNAVGTDSHEAAALEALRLANSPSTSLSNKNVMQDVLRKATDDSLSPFTLNEAFLDFGEVRARGGESREVTVCNHTSSKATAIWCFAKNSRYEVSPATLDVPAFGSAAFTVTSRPVFIAGTPAPRQAVLECYAFFKTMRSFRLVPENLCFPPACLALRCVTGAESPCPVKSALSAAKVEFPPVHVGDTAFQTVCVSNEGGTPFSFRARVAACTSQVDEDERRRRRRRSQLRAAPGAADDDDDGSDGGSELSPPGRRPAFTVFPELGVVQPQQKQIFLLSFEGQKPTAYRATAEIALENSRYRPLTLELIASAYTPSLILRNDATVYLKPTGVGSTTCRSYSVENPCRIDVAFRWEIPEHLARVVTVDPVQGVLKGNQKKAVRFTFSPDRVRKYVLRVPVVCMSTRDTAVHKQSQRVTLIGEGTQGSLTLEPFDMFLPTTVTGDETSREITLFNSTTCSTAYVLGWVNAGDDPIDPSEVELTNEATVLPARSHKTVKLTFRPTRRGKYHFKIFAKSVEEPRGGGGVATAWSSTKGEPSAMELCMLPTCSVQAEGGSPTVQIVDIKSASLRKSVLWDRCSVELVNSVLASEVTDDDTTTADLEFKNMLARHQRATFDFCTAVADSPKTVIHVTLKNTSALPARYNWILPHDSDFPMERWFHQPLPTDDEKHQDAIIDHQLFDIEPSEGLIEAGDTLTIRLGYHRRVVGYHRLPVVLHVRKGKKLVFDLLAHTISADERCLDAVTPAHTFQSMPIGVQELPRQYYELTNPTGNPVAYELGADPFVQMCQENYSFPIFQCLNGHGCIEPMSAVLLHFYFRPLEAKEYEMTVPITVHDGPTYTVTFKGTGYDPAAADAASAAGAKFSPIAVFPSMPDNPLFPVRLSQDALVFGKVCVHSLHRQLVILTNTHPSDAFAFEWNTQGQTAEQIMDMTPHTGLIQPGGQAVCKFTMYSGSVVHVLEQSIQCKVINHDLSQRRQRARDAIGEQAALSLDPHDGAGGDNAAALSPGKSRRQAKRVPVTQPPLRYQTTTQLRRTMQDLLEAADPEVMDENSDELKWMDVPENIVDVRLQAKVVSIRDYKATERDKLESHFFPTMAVYKQHVDPPILPPPATFEEYAYNKKAQDAYPCAYPEPVLTTLAGGHPIAAEIDFAVGYLAEIMLEVVHDPLIEQAYEELDETPVRFFSEFSKPPAMPSGEAGRLRLKAGTHVLIKADEAAGEPERRGVVQGHSRGRVGVLLDGGEESVGVPADRVVDCGLLAKEYDLLCAAHEDRERKRLLQAGEFQCFLEEVLDTLVFDVLQESIDNAGNPEASLVPPRQPRLRLAQQAAVRLNATA
ncbi:hypothetical protein DIPPA_02160 [Diplonema papillatum]|nr:hypothetical protein DIPPA_02160 [Diplonema papillatum]